MHIVSHAIKKNKKKDARQNIKRAYIYTFLALLAGRMTKHETYVTIIYDEPLTRFHAKNVFRA